MTITVAKLKRALVELRDEPEHGACDHFAALARNPTALTMLAEKLCERPAPLVMEDLHRPVPRARIERWKAQERPDWGNPGARVTYVCPTNPLKHKGGVIVEVNENGQPVIQWDNWARRTRVTWSMIELEKEYDPFLDPELDLRG